MYIFYGLLSAFFASLVTIIGKLGLKKVDPTFATMVRSSVMALFLIGLTLVLGKIPKGGIASLTSRDWLVLVGAGVAGALSWIFYFTALKVGPATRVAALDRLSLVFIAILASIFLSEALSVKAIGGIILMVSGVLLLTS
ncbi:EamA family transporter [Candidatus Woesebacteria bacterium]|nr:EamA family transporter [Candidatus Woesebacteria bacterium]